MSNQVRTPRTPQESAEHLAESLDSNTEAVNSLRKRYRWVLGLVVVVALTLGVVIKFNYDGNVERCKGGNELRVEQDEKWQAVSDYLEERGVGDDPDGRGLLAILSEDSERRDCTNINWLGH